jgi:outer membrane receptor protein involved in Fe transport
MTSRVGLMLAVLVALTLLVAVFPVLAQDATGKVVGTVLDPQSAVVPKATVSVKNVATGIVNSTTTDTGGQYQVLNLAIGDYNVTVEKEGFRKAVTKPYPLEINQSLRVDVTLTVGAASQTLEVNAAATQVETYNSTLGASVTSRELVDMPLNGRNILDLARLEPGVTDQNDENGAAGNFSIGGGRTDSVTYLLDGGLNNDLLDNSVVFDPNPDTVAEFRILESNYTSEYGRNGGGIISTVTKSGTNDYHGTAFDFARNDAFDANRFFNKREIDPATNTIVPRDTLKRQQFGATFGGPVGIPGLWLAKDKAFFFVGYQGQRQNQTERPSSGLINTFTPAEIKGDFSQSADAGTVATFLSANPYFQPDPSLAAQGIIDPTRIDPASKNVIAAGIIPVSASGILTPSAPARDDREELTGKVDYNFSQSDRLSVTLGWNKLTQTSPFAGGVTAPFPIEYLFKYGFVNISYTKNFSANVLNEFRVTAHRSNTLQDKPLKNLPGPAALGFGTIPDQVTGPPYLSFYGSNLNLGFSGHGPTTLVGNTFSFSDTLSWVRGRHNLKFGFQFVPYQNNTVYDYYVDGNFNYYGSTGSSTGSGLDLADFLMGLPDEYYQAPRAPTNIRTKSYYGFAQDEWKVTKNLVLNFGLRYEYSTPKLDTAGRSFSVIPGLQSKVFVNAPLGLVFPSDPGTPRGANFPDRNDFAPRFGFAWDPKGDGRTSLRGGIGMFYDVLKGEDNLQFNGQVPFFSTSDLFFNSPPDGGYVSSPNVQQDPYGSLGLTNPFPSKPPDHNIDFNDAGFIPFGGGSVYSVNPHLRTPYTFHYNLSLQRDLKHGFTGELSYVGSASHKLTGLKDVNPVILGDPNTTRVLNAQPKLQPEFGGYAFTYLDQFDNVGNAIYSSLQSSLRKQISDNRIFGSSYFTLAYTWSHNIDNSSGFREWSSNVPVGNPNLLRASSDLDIRHNLSFGGGWDLPFQNLWQSAPKRVIKGWSLYPIFSWRTGFPMDMRYFLNRSGGRAGPSGYGDSQLVGPNVTGPVQFYDPRKQTAADGIGAQWFNTSAFETASLDALNHSDVIPTASQRTYGSYARNSLRGPHRTNLDMSLAKLTSITERVNLEFRADFFNFFNHAEFRKPGLNPEAVAFGEITDTYDPRIIQFAAKIKF